MDKVENDKSMPNTRILVGSPVRQDPAILSEFLKSVESVNSVGIEFGYFFVDDNVDDDSSELMVEFQRRNNACSLQKVPKASQSSTDYLTDSYSHYWKSQSIERVTESKNSIIEYARQEAYDYLFLIDSDILILPDTIKHLLGLKLDIVSEIFWTSWYSSSRLMPQVWMQDQGEFFIKEIDRDLDLSEVWQKRLDFISMLKIPGVYEVGGLGACTLISRKALLDGVNFSPIKNISFWGEDRHFCIRAQALGLKLYVDTFMPAYHIYRKEMLSGVEEFRRNGFDPNKYVYNPIKDKLERKSNLVTTSHPSFSRLKPLVMKTERALKAYFITKRVIGPDRSLTLSMVVRNEENRYLKEVLDHAKKYVDRFVILDDASTDKTRELVKDTLEGLDYTLIVNKESMFSNEFRLRKKQWQCTIAKKPDWVLFLDADEMLEDAIILEKKWLLANNELDGYCFRLYDFWREGYYRDDQYWNAHTRYGPFMIRYQPWFPYEFRHTKQHCGRIPRNVLLLPYANIPIRVKHFGWMKEEDRQKKYNRYKMLDPKGKFGNGKQYESILDPNPHLEKFE